MLFGGGSKKHVLHRDVSGSDLENVVKSRSRILNEGLGVSAGLGFYHSIPLDEIETSQGLQGIFNGPKR